MMKAFPSNAEPMTFPITVPTAHALENGYYLDNIVREVSEFWEKQMEFEEPPLKLEVVGGTIPQNRVTLMNGRRVYWSEKPEQFLVANRLIVELLGYVYKMWEKNGEGLVNEFYTSHQEYRELEGKLSNFLINSITPIRKTIQDEGYLEGKCNRCPTIMRSIRKIVR